MALGLEDRAGLAARRIRHHAAGGRLTLAEAEHPVHEPATLLRPGAGPADARGISSSLPANLLSQSAARLRTLAFLYAFVFFKAGIFPMLVVPADLALFLSGFAHWGPTVIAIAVALLVAAVLGSKRLSLAAAMTIGVVFEIAGGYGIAVAEYTDPMVDLHARLRSPHTVKLFDFDIAADGAFYYVMELLDGLDAHTLLRRFGPTPPERAVFLLRQVCHSRSEAESCGREDYDFVKVLDFGIVKRLREGAQADLLRTGENAVQGRTDQPVPAALDQRVLSCLAKDPAARPQSARELSARLAEIEGANGWTQDRARTWWKAHAAGRA